MSTRTTYSLLQPAPSFLTWLDMPAPIAPEQEHTVQSMDSNRRIYHRAVSSTSILSSGSVIVQPLRVRNENVVPSRTISLSTIDFTEEPAITCNARKLSGRVSHKSSWGNDIPLPPQHGGLSIRDGITDALEDIDLHADNDTSHLRVNKISEQRLDGSSAPRLSFANDKENIITEVLPRRHISGSASNHKSHPFRRWMSTIHRKSLHRPRTLREREERWSLDDFDEDPANGIVLLQSPTHRRHKKSSSWASSGLLTAVKSASMSLATLSVAPNSRKARTSTHVRSSNRSSRLSHSFGRPSVDEVSISLPLIDEASRERAVKRRRTLEELLNTEESYVADLKVLVNVYFTLLATSTTTSHGKLTHIHENITEILVLHETLLRRLREVISTPTLSSISGNISKSLGFPMYIRRHSINMPTAARSKNPHFNVRRSLDTPPNRSLLDVKLVSEPKEAASVASVFEEMMSRFFVYEEYGARYESMLCDMTLTSKSIPNFHAYERGIEALANTLAPVNVREGCKRKGLTFGDLLIKPIQRVCKYPLLFSDLYKNLPVIDCPESHGEVEKVLFRLRETAMEINKATNDEDARDRIQRSWHLQDLLGFSDPTAAPFTLRSLGHPTLCGVLHVAYQSRHGVLGRYMLCALFNSCLILGVPNDNGRCYTIVASIGLGDLRIETTDNGKGLQCHTALYSWKIVFESDQQLFELIFSACSPPEEHQWKDELRRLSAKESQDAFSIRPISHAQYPILAIDIKPLGSILGQPGTLARRISIQRAATVGPRTNVCQVFIRNTHAFKDSIDSSTAGNLAVSRSQSLLSTNRIPVLAPRRVDRMRMEHDLAKVWTKDLLPYPGMGGNRGEHLFRASASSMMRKLSRASIASGFTKRSASFTSITNSKFEEVQKTENDLTGLEEECAEGAVSTAHDEVSPVGARAHAKSESLGVLSLRQIIPPARTSSRNSTRPKRTRGTWNVEEKGSSVIGTGGIDVGQAVKVKPGEKTLRNRWSSPISLIRSLSTEGMKHMFT